MGGLPGVIEAEPSISLITPNKYNIYRSATITDGQKSVSFLISNRIIKDKLLIDFNSENNYQVVFDDFNSLMVTPSIEDSDNTLRLKTAYGDIAKFSLIALSKNLLFTKSIPYCSTIGCSFISSSNTTKIINIKTQPPKVVNSPSSSNPSYPDGYFSANISTLPTSTNCSITNDNFTFISTYSNIAISGAIEGNYIKLTLRETQSNATANISIPAITFSKISDFIKSANNSKANSINGISIVFNQKTPFSYLKIDIRVSNGSLIGYVSFCDSYRGF